IGCVEGAPYTLLALQPRVWHLILVPHRGQPIDPPPRRVAHAVAAGAEVVPVGDEDAAVRGDADVARAEPVVRALDDVLPLDVVTGPLRLHVVAADVPGAGVGVQHLAPVFLG